LCQFEWQKECGTKQWDSLYALDENGEYTTYYGFVHEIWELEYGINFQILVFRCQWVEGQWGVSLNNYGLRIVDLSKVGYKDDPWVLGNRVAHVFYAQDLSIENKKAGKQKHVVVPRKQQIIGVDGALDPEDFNQFSEMPLFTDLLEKIINVDWSILANSLPYLHADGHARTVAG